MSDGISTVGKFHARPDIPRVVMPCCLCASFIEHGVVEPPESAALIFRATEFDGRVWVPAHHADFCPDPEPWTASFWHDRMMREAYKAKRRSRFR